MTEPDGAQPTLNPPPAYDPPPPYRPASQPSGGAPYRRRAIVAVTIIGVAAGVLGYVLSSSSGQPGASTPEAAVQRLLDAAQRNAVGRAKAVLCAGDRGLGQVSHLQSSGTITTYRIGARSIEDSLTVVEATYTTSTSRTPSTEKFPVVKEGGSWKVCFTRALSSIPTPIATVPPSGFTFPSADIPSGLASLSGSAGLCSGSTSGFGAASTYLGALALHVLQIAQACVYRNLVPESVSMSLAGTLFRPVTTDQNALVIDFQATNSTKRVTVTTAKESDGLYYVTAVQLD